MPCPAAVSAAAAALWLLAVLGPGPSLACFTAEDTVTVSESDSSLCSHCFYRQTPPRADSAGTSLQPLCHRRPGGQSFATLSRPTCDTAAYWAFHLSHGWTEGEGAELLPEEEHTEDKVYVPALLRGRGFPPHATSPTDSPLEQWDSLVSALVQSSVIPQCSALGGDLYIQTGAGGLGAPEDGGDECQTKPLWSAVCCAVPEGKKGFSVGLIRETEAGQKQVSVKELEERLGVAELFSEGCGGADAEPAAIVVGLQSEGLPGSIQELDADQTREGAEDGVASSAGSASEGEEGASDTSSQDSDEEVQESREETISAEQVAGVEAQPEETDDAEDAQKTSTDAATSESSQTEQRSEGQPGEEQSDGTKRDATHTRSATSESPASSSDYETVDEQVEDTNSSSVVVTILSTALSLLKAPLRPVFSRITALPGQVAYVLQEDLGVLSNLPGETFSLLHLVTSDFFSWMGSAAEMLVGIGETCLCSSYYCTSSMAGALLSSCHVGVTGLGTLAGDTVGVFGGALDNVWWVTKFFGGRLWEQSEGYVGTVVGEMGGQAKAVGGGVGRLMWRSGNGVGNVFRVGGGVVMGVVDMFIGAVRGAFGEEE